MKKRFADKVVIVTGASSGIGRETALAFADAGARVVVAARNAAALQALAAMAPGVVAVPADVTRAADVERLMATTVARFGRVDILVNNAGIGLRATVEQTGFAEAQRVMDVNFLGVLRCLQAVLPQMKQQPSSPTGLRGQIINVGSILSVLATPRHAIYSASKFALRALSDALRIELRDTGIDVILIMPGYTDTEFFEHQIRHGGPVHLGPFRGVHPRTVARAILRAAARRQREVVLTGPGKLGVCLKHWCPRLLDWTLSWEQRRTS